MWVRILEIGEYGFVEDCFRGVDHGCLFNAMLDVHVEDVEAADEQVVRIDQVVAYMRKFVYFFFQKWRFFEYEVKIEVKVGIFYC